MERVRDGESKRECVCVREREKEEEFIKTTKATWNIPQKSLKREIFLN